MIGLDINASAKFIKVLVIPEKILRKKKNIYCDKDIWPNFDTYSKYIREGRNTMDDLSIPAELCGTVIDVEPWFYEKMRWCIEGVITEENDPEYFI